MQKNQNIDTKCTDVYGLFSKYEKSEKKLILWSLPTLKKLSMTRPLHKHDEIDKLLYFFQSNV